MAMKKGPVGVPGYAEDGMPPALIAQLPREKGHPPARVVPLPPRAIPAPAPPPPSSPKK